MIKVYAYPCRYCRKVWGLVTDGSTDKYFDCPEIVYEAAREAHEIMEHFKVEKMAVKFLNSVGVKAEVQR